MRQFGLSFKNFFIMYWEHSVLSSSISVSGYFFLYNFAIVVFQIQDDHVIFIIGNFPIIVN